MILLFVVNFHIQTKIKFAYPSQLIDHIFSVVFPSLHAINHSRISSSFLSKWLIIWIEHWKDVNEYHFFMSDRDYLQVITFVHSFSLFSLEYWQSIHYYFYSNEVLVHSVQRRRSWPLLIRLWKSVLMLRRWETFARTYLPSTYKHFLGWSA